MGVDYKATYYPECRFGGFSHVDGTVVFYARVIALLDPKGVVLDLGCGRGAHQDDPSEFRRALRVVRGKVDTVIGLDVDPRAADNPFIDEFHLLESDRWPIDDASIDLCLCDNVLEHLADSDAFFRECRRVIKRGGYLCVRTTNLISYVGIAALLVANKWHAPVLRRVQANRTEADVFPTAYNCNTFSKIRRSLDKFGFSHTVYGINSEPDYLTFSRIAYRLGMIVHRLTPMAFATSIHAFAQRTAP